MRVLITGATGFIGRARVNQLVGNRNEVIAVGNQHTDRVSAVQANIDISERDSIKYLVARYRPDRIEHFASQSTVSVSRDDPWLTYRTNVLGAVSVLESAKRANIPVLMFTTDKYYGDNPVASESTTPLVTRGAYENSKLCQDLIAQSYIHQGCRIHIVRSCNVFGPYDYNRRIIPNTIRTLEQARQPVIFNNVIGIRQYVYIKDLLNALDHILMADDEHIFNVGTNIKLSQEEVVKKVIDVWNNHYNAEVVPEYTSAKDVAQTTEIAEQYLEWDRLQSYGWNPSYSFDVAIEEMLTLRDNDLYSFWGSNPSNVNRLSSSFDSLSASSLTGVD